MIASDRTDRAEARPKRPPTLAEGVELLGEFQGSGFKESPSLIRRRDGQILQLPPLLYQVVKTVDGQRDCDEIASIVTDQVQRGLSGEDVEFLIDEKLRPQHLVTAPDGSSPPTQRPDPFLAFRYRLGVVSERVSGALGTVFMPLFLPFVPVMLLAGLVAADWWIFFEHGVAQALRQALYHPGFFLPLLGAVILSAAFHEIGHASGCRYGGARPGRMGCGLYLAWPAFYTDVSDAYRLSRRGRLRTDLGGVYFNVVIILITTAVYAATRNLQVLVLLVVMEHIEIVHQLLPVVRLDGYYIVADITGVPDLFARIAPILRGLLFWRAPDPRVTILKRWVRLAVTTWVLIVVPLLVLELLIVLIHLPRILATAWDSADHLGRAAGRAVSHGDALGCASDVLQIVVLAIPIVGMLLAIQQLFRKGSLWAWRATRHHPIRRGLALAAISALVAVLLLAWIPSRNYRPIQPGERGTQGQGFRGLFSLVGGPGPLYSYRAATRSHHGVGGNRNPAIPSLPAGGPGSPVSPGVSGSPASTPAPAGGAIHTPSVSIPSVSLPRLPVTLPPITVPPVTVPPVTLPRGTVPPPTLPRVTVP